MALQHTSSAITQTLKALLCVSLHNDSRHGDYKLAAQCELLLQYLLYMHMSSSGVYKHCYLL